MNRSNAGASLLFFAIILVGIMTVLIALLAMFRTSTTAASSTQTVTQLESAKAALEQFVSAAGRLPCPADPSLNTGVEAPAGGAATCTFPAGTLPWSTIGIRREDAIDTWGFKISYRVYTGNNGSLTQPGGASMVNCDTVEPAPGGRTALAGNVGGLCAGDPADPTTFNTTEAQFLAGKGLVVNDFGTNVTDAAFVLVSHGPSGRGAFTGSGTATDPPGSVNEVNNTSAAGPWVAAAPMTANMSPDNVNYFDDVIAYERLPTLIRRANLGARDWPEPVPPPPPPPPTVVADYILNAATIAAALGHGVAPGSLSTNTINFGTATVTASGAADLSLESSGGHEGVGVAGGVFGNLITSVGSEYVRVGFTSKATKLGLTLNNFGTTTVGITFTERVQLTFFDGAVAVGAPIIKNGCRADGGLASYEINVGVDFDMVEVKPIASTPAGFTALSLAALKACTSLEPTCASSLAAVSNNCP